MMVQTELDVYAISRKKGTRVFHNNPRLMCSTRSPFPFLQSETNNCIVTAGNEAHFVSSRFISFHQIFADFYFKFCATVISGREMGRLRISEDYFTLHFTMYIAMLDSLHLSSSYSIGSFSTEK